MYFLRTDPRNDFESWQKDVFSHFRFDIGKTIPEGRKMKMALWKGSHLGQLWRARRLQIAPRRIQGRKAEQLKYCPSHAGCSARMRVQRGVLSAWSSDRLNTSSVFPVIQFSSGRHEHDSPQGNGAITSEIRQTASILCGQIVFMMNTFRDQVVLRGCGRSAARSRHGAPRTPGHAKTEHPPKPIRRREHAPYNVAGK